ncbi:hypothetical protein T08_4948 [Trichinella sp. T8]|nr:hypothetical protein T08_4948 [Trichinella sp. T8]
MDDSYQQERVVIDKAVQHSIQRSAVLLAHMDPTQQNAGLPTHFGLLLSPISQWDQDINCLTTEVFYGSVLRLPADFFVGGAPPVAATRRRSQRHSERRCVISGQRGKSMASRTRFYSHVFAQETNSTNSLAPFYSGPYRVLDRSDKVITIDNEGVISKVAISRTKPAFITSDHANPTPAAQNESVSFSTYPFKNYLIF